MDDPRLPDRLHAESAPPPGHRFSMVSSPPTPWPDFLVGQAGHPVRVALAVSDAHLRYGIARELQADERVHVVGQAGSLREGRRLVALHDFDVLLVDLNLGDGPGLALLEISRAARPFAEVVVIAAGDDETHAMRAFALGAAGYLVRQCWFGSYAQAVLQVVNGGAAIAPRVARRLLGRLESGGGPVSGPSNGLRNTLSPQERTILRLVAAGHSGSQIAGRLAISPQTVNTHVRNMYRKLQVRTRAQAVSAAAGFGWL